MIWVVAVPNTGLVQDPEVRPAGSEAADTGVGIDPVEAERARSLEHASAQGNRDRARPVVRQSDFRRVGTARGQQVNEHVPVLPANPPGIHSCTSEVTPSISLATLTARSASA